MNKLIKQAITRSRMNSEYYLSKQKRVSSNKKEFEEKKVIPTEKKL